MRNEPELHGDQRMLDHIEHLYSASEEPADLTARFQELLALDEGAGRRHGFDAAYSHHRKFALAGLASLALAATLVAGLLAMLPGQSGRIASAEQILQRAQSLPEGIETLVATQRIETFFLGGNQGVLATRGEFRAWFDGPNRLRIETDYTTLTTDGEILRQSNEVRVWDGDEYWTYDGAEVHVVLQDPSADIYSQGVMRGSAPGVRGDAPGASCRSAEVVGEEEVAGRLADVIELGRPRCGVPFPGTDGPAVLWVDQETGFILKAEQFAINGALFARVEVTNLEFNTPIDEELLSFTLPEDAHVRDFRDQPMGAGFGSVFREPDSISLQEARKEATFEITLPGFVPEGFELEAIQHYWGSELAREHRSHAGWVLLRYVDQRGNWLVIGQGFGGFVGNRHLWSPPPPEEYVGTIDIKGATAHWVRGWGLVEQWQPSIMTSLHWQAGRFGSGWARSPDGEVITGSPFYIGLASNVLNLDDLVRVAESLE